MFHSLQSIEKHQQPVSIVFGLGLEIWDYLAIEKYYFWKCQFVGYRAIRFARFSLLSSKPSLGILNRYQFHLFRGEALVNHNWYYVVSDMRISVSAEMYLKSQQDAFKCLIVGIRKNINLWNYIENGEYERGTYQPMLGVYILTHENSIQFLFFLQQRNACDTLRIWQHIDWRKQLKKAEALDTKQVELNITFGSVGEFHEVFLFHQRN